MSSVAGKLVLITAASSGIGAACARRFADEGAVIAGLDLGPPRTRRRSWPATRSWWTAAGRPGAGSSPGRLPAAGAEVL